MLDFSHIPSPYSSNVKTFNSASAVPQVWAKPRGASMVYIQAIGAGGGGGNGFTRASGVQGGGGGGGGGAGIGTLLVPAYLLPDILYVFVGSGGLATIAGVDSVVSFYPSASSPSLIYGPGGNAGGTGTGAAGGAASGIVAAPTTATRFLNMGLFVGYAGSDGPAGGVSGVGADSAALATGITCGGASGAGVSVLDVTTAGGQVTGITNYLQNVSAGADPGGAGNLGNTSFAPLCATGGSGGGSGGVVVGGAGGAGGVGSGGGGGGAGTTGGAGGRGGDGIVIIISW